MKIDRKQIAFETPEYVALPVMRGKYRGFVGLISKKMIRPDGTAQLRGAITLRPYEDRSKQEVEISVDEFIREY